MGFDPVESLQEALARATRLAYEANQRWATMYDAFQSAKKDFELAQRMKVIKDFDLSRTLRGKKAVEAALHASEEWRIFRDASAKLDAARLAVSSAQQEFEALERNQSRLAQQLRQALQARPPPEPRSWLQALKDTGGRLAEWGKRQLVRGKDLVVKAGRGFANGVSYVYRGARSAASSALSTAGWLLRNPMAALQALRNAIGRGVGGLLGLLGGLVASGQAGLAALRSLIAAALRGAPGGPAGIAVAVAITIALGVGAAWLASGPKESEPVAQSSVAKSNATPTRSTAPTTTPSKTNATTSPSTRSRETRSTPSVDAPAAAPPGIDEGGAPLRVKVITTEGCPDEEIAETADGIVTFDGKAVTTADGTARTTLAPGVYTVSAYEDVVFINVHVTKESGSGRQGRNGTLLRVQYLDANTASLSDYEVAVRFLAPYCDEPVQEPNPPAVSSTSTAEPTSAPEPEPRTAPPAPETAAPEPEPTAAPEPEPPTAPPTSESAPQD